MYDIDYASWIDRWDKIDPLLDKLYMDKRWRQDPPYEWGWLIGHVIHDGRQERGKLKFALDPKQRDYSDIVAHRIWIQFSNWVAFGEYIIFVEGRDK